MKLLNELLAQLNGVIRATNINQSRTESGRGDPKQLAKDQDKLAKEVDKLAGKMGAPKTGGKPKDSDAKGTWIGAC